MKIDLETSELIFDEFATNWKIKTDVSRFKPEDVDSFNQAKERIMDAIVDGRFEIIDPQTVRYTFAFSDDLECKFVDIRRPRGATFMQADSGGKDDAMKKMFLMLGEMTKKNASFYSKVDGVDIKVLTSITTLFFAS